MLERQQQLINTLENKGVLNKVLEDIVKLWEKCQRNTGWNISALEAKDYLAGECDTIDLMRSLERDTYDNDIGLPPFKRENENVGAFESGVEKIIDDVFSIKPTLESVRARMKALVEDVTSIQRSENEYLTNEQKAILYKKIMSIDFNDLKEWIVESPWDYFDYSITGGGREYMGDFWGTPAYKDTYPEVDASLDPQGVADRVIKMLIYKEKGIEDPSEYRDYTSDGKGTYLYYKEMPKVEQDYIVEICSSKEFLDKIVITNADWNKIRKELLSNG